MPHYSLVSVRLRPPNVNDFAFKLTPHMRTDLIFILLDRPDESHDRLISEHIMNSHSAGSHSASSSGKRNRGAWEAEGPLTGADTESFTLQQRLRWKIQEALRASRSADLRGVVEASGVVSVELMRRYIEYAKQYVHPHLSPGAAKVLQRLYLTMRSEASAGQSIPVTTRHLESLIRLSQARARVDLREEVSRRAHAPDKCCRRNWMCYAMYSGAYSPHCCVVLLTGKVLTKICALHASR
jgi:DNA replicative helicase MCM subunit Mcm2 (Cdc46/Mcm family)